MARQRKRAKPGDVLELQVAHGFAYLHYIGKHPQYGDAVLVIPRPHDRQLAVTSDLFTNAYVAFYPAMAAVAQQLAEIVGHLQPPALPRRFRRRGAIIRGVVKTWVVEDDDTGESVVRDKLSDEELQLPIASIWNHEFLVQRIVAGWTPAQEGGDQL